MKYEAAIYQTTVGNHSFWVAESKVLKGCVGQGDTYASAKKNWNKMKSNGLKPPKKSSFLYQPLHADNK